jgi:hypothetical protein
MHVVSAVLAAPFAVPVVSAAPLMPHAPVTSVLLTPYLHLLHAVVEPLVPSALPFFTRLRALSHSAQEPPAHEDPFSFSLCLGAPPLPGTAPHDTPPPISAMAPLPAAAAGPALGPAKV